MGGFLTLVPPIISHLNSLKWWQQTVPKSSGKRALCDCFGVFTHSKNSLRPACASGLQWTLLLPAARSVPPLSCPNVGHPPRPSCSNCPHAFPPLPYKPVTGDSWGFQFWPLAVPSLARSLFCVSVACSAWRRLRTTHCQKKKKVHRAGACHTWRDEGCAPSQRCIFPGGWPTRPGLPLVLREDVPNDNSKPRVQ